MGVVELAEQRSLGRLVAIKQPHPGPMDADAVAALVSEGITTGRLEHPNIVPVHALGRGSDGRAVLVMKRIEGVPLADLVHRADHPRWARETRDRLTLFVETAIEVLHALAFAHARGVVHRDVKPENVMLGDYGEVYLLDWGIAAPLGQPADGIAGTPSYMAPEMLTPLTDPPDA
jgi:serine/threonine-protein kinase